MNYDDVYDVEARKKVQTSLRFRVRKERERGGGGREGRRERERERERERRSFFTLFFFDRRDWDDYLPQSSFYHSQMLFLFLIILIIFDRITFSSLNIATSFTTVISRNLDVHSRSVQTGFISASSIFYA